MKRRTSRTRPSSRGTRKPKTAKRKAWGLRPWIAALAIIAAAVFGGACDEIELPESASDETSGNSDGWQVGEAQIARAREELAKLRTAGAPSAAPYDRDRLFPWADTNHNKCETREDILARDLTEKTRKGRCVITRGELVDPYTGKTVKFRRGPDTSSRVQIDHLYPLHRAWIYGASTWTAEKRVKFANDRGNLLAVIGRENSRKGDQGPGTWLPPSPRWRCVYATTYIDVARIYRLPVTSGDRRALARTLKACPKTSEG